MKSPAGIRRMEKAHVSACKEIVAASEPWKTLGEGIDFGRFIGLKQAYVCLDMTAGKPRVAGFVIFTPGPVFARGGYLRAIGVAPGARRQGLGEALLSFAEDRTARRSAHFFLCVSSFNRTAQSFYRKMGYRRVGRLPDLLAPGVTEYIYWKRLRPASRAQGEPLPCPQKT